MKAPNASASRGSPAKTTQKQTSRPAEIARQNAPAMALNLKVIVASNRSGRRDSYQRNAGSHRADANDALRVTPDTSVRLRHE